MTSLQSSVIMRFVKAFLAGFFSVAVVAAVPAFHSIASWIDLYHALNTLGLASTVGGLSGLFLAAEKYFNWTDVPQA